MEGIKSPSSVTIGALTRNIKEFEEKIQNGTEDPDRFLTLSEIEELWGKLIGDTNILYSDMLQSLIQNVDEKELIRQKKRIPSQRNKPAYPPARRAADIYPSWGAPLQPDNTDPGRWRIRRCAS